MIRRCGPDRFRLLESCRSLGRLVRAPHPRTIGARFTHALDLFELLLEIFQPCACDCARISLGLWFDQPPGLSPSVASGILLARHPSQCETSPSNAIDENSSQPPLKIRILLFIVDLAQLGIRSRPRCRPPYRKTIWRFCRPSSPMQQRSDHRVPKTGYQHTRTCPSHRIAHARSLTCSRSSILVFHTL